jgi:outer membrane murein-binding lipoprotein Lpp
VVARLSELSSAAARLAENLDKLGRGQASLADSLKRATERLEAALSSLASAGGADLASRLDAVASDVKTLQAQVRALSEQVVGLSRSLRSLKEELAEELAGEEEEEEGRGR